MIQRNQISVIILTMTSSPAHLSFYGPDVIQYIDVTSPPSHFSYYGHDVIL